MNEIEREVENFFSQTVMNAEEVSNQTEKLENITHNSEEISHNRIFLNGILIIYHLHLVRFTRLLMNIL